MRQLLRSNLAIFTKNITQRALILVLGIYSEEVIRNVIKDYLHLSITTTKNNFEVPSREKLKKKVDILQYDNWCIIND